LAGIPVHAEPVAVSRHTTFPFDARDAQICVSVDEPAVETPSIDLNSKSPALALDVRVNDPPTFTSEPVASGTYDVLHIDGEPPDASTAAMLTQ
jgi:hypothetical protein